MGKRKMGRRVRLGIAGLGMGMAHARACLTARGVELAALSDINTGLLEERREKLVSQIGQNGFDRLSRLPFHADYREMFVRGDLDAVLIALPTAMHVEASLQAMRHGLHVLCEKPPATSSVEMARVAAFARRQGLTYMYARQQRFDPIKQLVRRMVARGRLGAIYHAESNWIRSGAIPFRHGWGVNKAHGGGVLLDLGVHAIDDAWFLMGCPRPIEAFAAMHCSFPHLGKGQRLQLPYDADDCSTGMIRFENGASLGFTVTFAMNTAGPRNAPIRDEGSADWRELSVYGVRAGAELHDSRLILRRNRRQTVNVRELRAAMPAGKTELMLQVEHFCSCLLRGRRVQNTAEQAVMLMQMLDALSESARTGSSVTVGSPAVSVRRRGLLERKA